jgi:hypothetical protein
MVALLRLGEARRNQRAAFADARTDSDIEIGVEVRNDAGGWRHPLAFNRRGRNDFGPMMVHDSVLQVSVDNDETLVIDWRPINQGRSVPEQLRQTSLQQVTQNQALRELHKFFGSERYLYLTPKHWAPVLWGAIFSTAFAI